MPGERNLDARGLVAGGEKDVVVLATNGKITVDTVTDVTRQGTDKLARQNENLLHEPQLQRLLERLNDQETHLNEAIDHLKFFQPGSAEVVLARTEGTLNALARIDKSEVSRLGNHGGAKGERAKSRIAEQLDQIEERVKTLRDALATFDPPETSTSGITNQDRRQLKRAAKLLEHVQSSLGALQGRS